MPRRLTPLQILGLAGLALLLAVPYVLPLLGAKFWVNIVAEIMIWSLFAASVNLLLGYTGLLSFGQALYFGFGAYGVALGIDMFGLSFWPAALLGVFVAAACAAFTGIFAARLTWHYFAIITVVFSLIFFFVAVGWKSVTGGDDGRPFAMPPVLKIGGVEFTMLDQTFQYYFIMAVVGACFYLMHVILKSPLGYTFVAVRENASRLSLIGYSPYLIRYISFVIAGTFAGVAGVLFALFARYASAQYLFWTVSGEGVIWALIGGSGTLFGPVLGSAFLIVVREELSVYWEHYLLVVGVIVILFVAFAPEGLMGLLTRALDRLTKKPAERAVPEIAKSAPRAKKRGGGS
ncbi:MAG: branched-chain amino acid ABC transporter permease [Rhodospirillales bacterium]|nr:branched-chain amino acid ABC transporter permease [Rhodospirillales bacterium]